MKAVGYLQVAMNLIKYRKREISDLKRIMGIVEKYENGTLEQPLEVELDEFLTNKGFSVVFKSCILVNIENYELQKSLGLWNKFDKPDLDLRIYRANEANIVGVGKTIETINNLIEDRNNEIKMLRDSMDKYTLCHKFTPFAQQIVERFNREYNDALKKLNKIEFITTE